MLLKKDRELWLRQLESQYINPFTILDKYEDKEFVAKELLGIVEERGFYYLLLPLTNGLNLRGIHVKSCLNCNRWCFKEKNKSTKEDGTIEMILNLEGEGCNPRLISKELILVSASKGCKGWVQKQKEG